MCKALLKQSMAVVASNIEDVWLIALVLTQCL